MIGTTRIPNTPHSEIRVIEPEKGENWSTKPRTELRENVYLTSGSKPGDVVPGRVVHFRALDVIWIMLLELVTVLAATTQTLVVVEILMFVDESLASALVYIEVLMLVLGLLSNSNCCYTDHTADRTELHSL